MLSAASGAGERDAALGTNGVKFCRNSSISRDAGDLRGRLDLWSRVSTPNAIFFAQCSLNKKVSCARNPRSPQFFKRHSRIAPVDQQLPCVLPRAGRSMRLTWISRCRGTNNCQNRSADVQGNISSTGLFTAPCRLSLLRWCASHGRIVNVMFRNSISPRISVGFFPARPRRRRSLAPNENVVQPAHRGAATLKNVVTNPNATIGKIRRVMNV